MLKDKIFKNLLQWFSFDLFYNTETLEGDLWLDETIVLELTEEHVRQLIAKLTPEDNFEYLIDLEGLDLAYNRVLKYLELEDVIKLLGDIYV